VNVLTHLCQALGAAWDVWTGATHTQPQLSEECEELQEPLAEEPEAPPCVLEPAPVGWQPLPEPQALRQVPECEKLPKGSSPRPVRKCAFCTCELPGKNRGAVCLVGECSQVRRKAWAKAARAGVPPPRTLEEAECKLQIHPCDRPRRDPWKTHVRGGITRVTDELPVRASEVVVTRM
jgi:hypothetical protein